MLDPLSVIIGLIGGLLMAPQLIEAFYPKAIDRIDHAVAAVARLRGSRVFIPVALTLSVIWPTAIVTITTPIMLVNFLLFILSTGPEPAPATGPIEPFLFVSCQLLFLLLAVAASFLTLIWGTISHRPPTRIFIFVAIGSLAPAAIVTCLLIFDLQAYLALSDWLSLDNLLPGLLAAALPIIVFLVGSYGGIYLARVAGAAAYKVLSYMKRRPDVRLGSLMIGFVLLVLAAVIQIASS